jgi:hypothetical protein
MKADLRISIKDDAGSENLLAPFERRRSTAPMKRSVYCFWVGLFLAGVLNPGCSSLRHGAGHAGVIHLIHGDEHSQFYTFLKDFKPGVDNDPDHVFTFTNGMLHISGEHYGYAATRQTNFSNYKLIAEFRWGEKTWAPRETNARDSGILVHCVGKDQVWPKSIEAQIIEGGTGDILVVSGAYLTVGGVTKGPEIARFDRPGRNPWKDQKGFRGPHEIEAPTGQWNKLEITCDHDRFSYKVNGHVTLTGTNASPQMGKILLQSEGAEVYFRRLDLYPLK